MSSPHIDIVEVRHEKLNILLIEAMNAALRLSAQWQSCKRMNCNANCDHCEQALQKAQEKKKAALFHIDECYQKAAA